MYGSKLVKQVQFDDAKNLRNVNYIKQTISSLVEDSFITRSQVKLALLEEDQSNSSVISREIEKIIKKYTS